LHLKCGFLVKAPRFKPLLSNGSHHLVPLLRHGRNIDVRRSFNHNPGAAAKQGGPVPNPFGPPAPGDPVPPSNVPNTAGYIPPSMEVKGVDKEESQWEVLARIQAKFGVVGSAYTAAGRCKLNSFDP
jgi:hypothetical protein